MYVLCLLRVSYVVSSLITNLTYSVLSILPCSIMGNLICYRSYRRLNVTIVSEMSQTCLCSEHHFPYHQISTFAESLNYPKIQKYTVSVLIS